MRRGIFLILSFSASMVLAKEKGDQKSLEQARRTLAAQSQEYEKVLRSLDRISRETRKIVRERSQLERRRYAVEKQVNALNEKISELEKRRQEQRKVLVAKIGFLQKFNSLSWMRFLTQAENSARLERNMKFLGLLGRHDLQTLRGHALDVRELRRKKTALTARLEEVRLLGEQIDRQETALKEQNQIRSKLLAGLREEQRRTLGRIRELRSRSARLQKLEESGLLDALEGGSIADLRGELPHPVRGILSRNYGLTRDRESQVLLTHRGWFYATPRKEAVTAIHAGRVAHVGDLPEYGPLLILDHGDHYYSLYAGLSKFLVRHGDNVQAGQRIGFTGPSLFERQLGLYFEIRHFSEAVDPKLWMKGRFYEVSGLERGAGGGHE